MQNAKAMLRQIPGFSAAGRLVRSYGLRSQSTEQVFTDIFQSNSWRGSQSVSGCGSDDDQTALLKTVLPGLFAELGIDSILDIPCGDFHWMQDLDLATIDYCGADIVSDLVASNNDQFGGDSVRFLQKDLIRDSLPQVDLLLCRDCLVHLSATDIRSALKNICDSGATYLLTTTFSARTKNIDIATGQWRPVNLELSPFDLPAPMRLINEGCTESNGEFADKALGLWRLADLKDCLAG